MTLFITSGVSLVAPSVAVVAAKLETFTNLPVPEPFPGEDCVVVVKRVGGFASPTYNLLSANLAAL